MRILSVSLTCPDSVFTPRALLAVTDEQSGMSMYCSVCETAQYITGHEAQKRSGLWSGRFAFTPPFLSQHDSFELIYECHLYISRKLSFFSYLY